ncbi:MAG: hypothetical protein KGM42_07915 [Hyphomicrobiales bacterium]|nr:hypothetical protein [Hyphomicrobiales bacterium]
MPFRYIALSGAFNARTELEDLIRSLAANEQRYEDLLSALDLADTLKRCRERGFLEVRRKWERGGREEVFLWTDRSIFAAARVPGDGRADTFDATFLGVRLLDAPNFAAIAAFLEEMAERHASGASEIW